MKKTYKESWFVRTDHMRDSMTVDNLFSHAPTAQLPCDSSIWTNLVLLQVESPMEEGYCVCEVIRKEDYDKYQEYSLDYMAFLENKVQNLERDLKIKNESLDSANEDVSELYRENQKLYDAIRAINERIEMKKTNEGNWKLVLNSLGVSCGLTLDEVQALESIGVCTQWNIDKEFVLDETN